jgi:hypothetical protein
LKWRLVRALLRPELLQKRLHGWHLGQWLVRLLPHAHLLQCLGLLLLELSSLKIPDPRRWFKRLLLHPQLL